MSNKEALDWCEQFTDNLVMVDVDTKKRTLGLQAMQVCKSALKKQIPKKPKILTYKLLVDAGWKHGCPNCGCAVGINNNIRFAYEEYLEPNESFCCSCGQALDWGDSE